MAVSAEEKQHIRQLLIEGRKIQAIKFIKMKYGLPLKEAKRLIDIVDETIASDEYQVREIKPANSRVGTIVGVIFTLVGLGLLVITLIVYVDKQGVVSYEENTMAEVIENPSKPVFEYTYDGEIYRFQSSTESTPPSYELGETVPIFVNPENPNEIVVDTFTDRWLAVTIVGSMGLIFTFVGLLATRMA